MGKALIKVGYGCNDHCTFCHTLEVRDQEDSGAGVAKKIDRAAELGHEMVVLSGGEPTLRKELVPWARYANRRGLSFGLVTNGRMLSYAPLVEQLLELGLSYAYVSLHGGSAKVHNASVRSTAFEQTLGGIKNLHGRIPDLTINCVITRSNLGHLNELVETLAPFHGLQLNLSMTEPKGGGWKLFDQIVPKVSEVATGVDRAMQHAAEIAPGLLVGHGGIPFCLLPGWEHRFGDLRSHGFLSMSETWEEDFFPIDDRNKVHPPACDDCSLRGPCPGLYSAYYKRRGDRELTPKVGTRSNAYHFVTKTTVPWPKGTVCPVLQGGISPFDKARHLLIRRGGSLQIAHCTSRDFTDTELLHIKEDLGQIYCDISEKDAPDDFAKDLRALHKCDTCLLCEAQQACTGAYTLADEDLFSRDDARLRQRLSELSGDLLDIGCGEAHYAELFAQKAEAGSIHYRGIDPNLDQIKGLAQRFPWGHFEAKDAESLELEDEALDHVLLLRSYNHLQDPQQVLSKLCDALRPGGTLLLADNVAFGLLRSRNQADRAETGPAEFEHYRNADDTQAMSSVASLPLNLIHRESVAVGTSNQWVLHFRKRGAEHHAGHARS